MTNANPRRYRWQDVAISSAFKCIRTVLEFPYSPTQTTRTNPSASQPTDVMTPQEKQHSAGLMRVNHCGEICAQALYLGQSITARSPMLKEAFNQAAAEECDHLSWCADRLRELDSHKSYLNPFWFSGSLLIGAFAGIVGDKWSLGFLAQTEQQVYRHLGDHLEKLPVSDLKSRAIVEQMQREEAQHAQTAISHGAKELPLPIQTTMRWVSGVMTTVAYYL